MGGRGSLDDLEERIGHRFADRSLLERAVSHRSWIAETEATESNERLEFLGDAVLGWVIADLAFRRFPDLGEGTLTDLRKSVVNARALAVAAREVDLGRHVRLGRGEAAARGDDKDSILSDAFEAVIGAVYVDAGERAAFDLVERLVGPHLERAPETLHTLDAKSALQERLATLGMPAPEYSTTSTGPDHDKRFEVAVSAGSGELGRGRGRSKKLAEQAAAAVALEALADRG